MFGFFKKKLTQARRYNVSPMEGDLVTLTARLIAKQVDMYENFKLGSSAKQSGSKQLLSDKYIYPWIVGYCTGLLDAVTQTQANRMQFTSEMQSLLYSVVFEEENLHKTIGCYIASNEASSPEHAFYPVYEEYILGMNKAFSEIIEGKPVMGLLNHLMQE